MDFLDSSSRYIVENDMIVPGDRVVCAVSGGTDSVCLLDVLYRLSQRLGFALYAAHYNHRLRGDESDGDEAFVRKLCDAIGVPLIVGSGDVSGQAARLSTGIEETARKLRYAFFSEAMAHFGASKTATAHNADDNLETVIMHLARGTGLRGLCGIPPVRDCFVRPILFAPRSEIEKYCLENGLPHREDSTNADTRYTRNRIRAEVLPVLRSVNPLAAEAAVQMCAALRLDEEYLTKVSNPGDGAIIISRLGEKTLAIRALRDKFQQLSDQTLSSRQLEAIYGLCQSDDPSARLDLPGKIVARREYGKLIFEAEAEKNAGFCYELRPECEIQAGQFLIFCKISSKAPDSFNFKNTFVLKRDMIVGALYVRSRKTGDVIAFPGRPSKSLKKLFIDEKVPAAIRDRIPIIADDSGVLAVSGFGADNRCAPHCSGDVYIITVRPADSQ